MEAPTLTTDLKANLKMVALRSILDPKRFYKKDKSLMKFPKYFQMGEVIAGPADTYSSRLPKTQRKASLVDEILDNVQNRQYVKKQYLKIQEANKPNPRFKHKAVADRNAAKKQKLVHIS
jgi:hypothetical protein